MGPPPALESARSRLRVSGSFLALLWRLSRLCLTADTPPPSERTLQLRALGVLALLTALVLLYIACGYFVLLLPGELYSALVDRNRLGFCYACALLLLACSATIVVKTLIGVTRDLIANTCRERLSAQLHRWYFSRVNPPTFYTVCRGESVDNPDQRIVDDARKFVFLLLALVAGGYGAGAADGAALVTGAGVVEVTVNIVWYSWQTYRRTGTFGVLVAYLWSAVVAVIGIHVVNLTSPLLYRQEALEANFRFEHVQLRTHAEEVALYGRGEAEAHTLRGALLAAVRNMRRVILMRAALALINHGFAYYVTLVMYAAIGAALFSPLGALSTAPQAASSSSSAGDAAKWIAQSSGVFISLLYAFTTLLQINSPLSSLVACAFRVDGLLRAADAATQSTSPAARSAVCRHGDKDAAADDDDGDDDRIAAGVAPDLASAGLPRGDGRPSAVLAVRSAELQLELPEGRSLLIRGPSGCGKTTLLRKLRGLWRDERVLVARPALLGAPPSPRKEQTVLFLPQGSFLAAGCTLAEQVLYPLGSTTAGEGATSAAKEMRAEWALRELGLAHIVERFGMQMGAEWGQVLSAGERQRVALARVLVHRPTVAVLDEATAALDEHAELAVLRQLRAVCASVLVVSHRSSLLREFDDLLSFEPQRGWTLTHNTPAAAAAH